MTDLRKFDEFVSQMDWEGGIQGIIQHGYDGCGDVELEILLQNVELYLTKVQERIEEIEAANVDELKNIRSEYES